MNHQETCVDCSGTSPQSDTDHTLISSFGWRMMRRTAASGEHLAEWRCPACWQAFKASRPTTAVATPTMAPEMSLAQSGVRRKPD